MFVSDIPARSKTSCPKTSLNSLNVSADKAAEPEINNLMLLISYFSLSFTSKILIYIVGTPINKVVFLSSINFKTSSGSNLFLKREL